MKPTCTHTHIHTYTYIHTGLDTAWTQQIRACMMAPWCACIVLSLPRRGRTRTLSTIRRSRCLDHEIHTEYV